MTPTERNWKTFVYITKSTLLFCGVLTCFSVIKIDREERKRINLHQEVARIADTTIDNYTSPKEWAQVYNEIGINYDVHNSNPKNELTINQLEKYLVNH